MTSKALLLGPHRGGRGLQRRALRGATARSFDAVDAAAGGAPGGLAPESVSLDAGGLVATWGGWL